MFHFVEVTVVESMLNCVFLMHVILIRELLFIGIIFKNELRAETVDFTIGEAYCSHYIIASFLRFLQTLFSISAFKILKNDAH